MIYGIALSLRHFLSVYMPEASEVVLMRDGITLTGRVKPFLTVEYLGDTDDLIAAGRESYEEISLFQVGVRASNYGELLRLQGKMRTVLRRPDGIILYDDNAVATDKRIAVNVSGFTPITSDDSSQETENHRGYFDVSVRIYRNTGDSDFTQ